MSPAATLSGLVREILQLSRVKEGERVALVTTTDYDPVMLDAYLVALEELGAEALRLILPRRTQERGLIQPLGRYAATVLREAGMVIRPVTRERSVVPDIFMYDEVFSEIL